IEGRDLRFERGPVVARAQGFERIGAEDAPLHAVGRRCAGFRPDDEQDLRDVGEGVEDLRDEGGPEEPAGTRDQHAGACEGVAYLHDRDWRLIYQLVDYGLTCEGVSSGERFDWS